jgi:predicted transposase YdaD
LNNNTPINPQHKDSFFTKLFSEPERALSLYNAISQSDYPLGTPLEITTLEDVFFRGRYNDLSFVVDGKLVVLIEHQSTISPNIAIRLMIYLGQIYNRIVKGRDIYAATPLKIPRPEFIVLYNGTDNHPPERTIKLSDLFLDLPENHKPSGDLELTVRVLNINKGQNQAIVERSVELNGYVVVIDEIRKNKNAGMSNEEAIAKAVKDCADRKILIGFLEKYGSEVINMLNHEFNLDEYGKVRHEDGKKEGILEAAISFLREGIAPEKVAKCTGLPLERVYQLQTQ